MKASDREDRPSDIESAGDLENSGELQALRDAFSGTGTRARPKPSWEREVWRRVLRDEAPAPRAPWGQRFAIAAVAVMCLVVGVMGWKLWTLGEELEHHRAAARQLLIEKERAQAEAELQHALRRAEAALESARAEQLRLERELEGARDPHAEVALRRQIVAKQQKIRELNERNRVRRARDRQLRRGATKVKCDPKDPLCGL